MSKSRFRHTLVGTRMHSIALDWHSIGTRLALDWHWIGNRVPIECHSSAIRMRFDFISELKWLLRFIFCGFGVLGVCVHCTIMSLSAAWCNGQSASRVPIECHSSASECQSSANRVPTKVCRNLDFDTILRYDPRAQSRHRVQSRFVLRS